ncbi:MAG TPA: alkaline phosphatase family protein [Parvularculaceae bacterium]|nr:alkaline phosphatase family protein [Parvularculaceae bacterium]
MKLVRSAAILFVCLFAVAVRPAAAAQPRNIVLFVADGLRYGSVTPDRTPIMAKLKSEGVDFANSHSLYPTLTTVNASAIATGHYVGDTGDFGNVIYAGFPVMADHGSPVTFLEDDTILGEMNAHFGGNYIQESSLLEAARKAGFETAVIGKLGPTRIQALTASTLGLDTVVIDDSTGHGGGIALPPGYPASMHTAFIGAETPGVSVPNFTQQVYFAKIAARVVLPKFKASGKPFIMVFWSRDPDASQHGTQDSIGEVAPGIDGPTAEAGVRDADASLGMILDTLKALGLDKTTDVFVTADHGFATIAKNSVTSPAAKFTNDDYVPLRELPSGFLAIDVAAALSRPLYDPNDGFRAVDYANAKTPLHGAGYIGLDREHPDAIVAANGGSGLIYVPGKDARERAQTIVSALMKQDYVSGIFVNDRLGDIPGTLPMSAVNLVGNAKTPQPSIYVNFRSFHTKCDDPLMCAAIIADTGLKTGQGMHGSFSRAETRNFMAAIGPDFKKRFIDEAPVSNADIAPTLAHLAGIEVKSKGKLKGRVVTEALQNGVPVQWARNTIASKPGEDGLRTVLDLQTVGDVRYFDAAGFPGRTVGLTDQKEEPVQR